MRNLVRMIFVTILLIGAAGVADTFVQKTNGKRYIGYRTTKTRDGEVAVVTKQDGLQFLDLENWEVELNQKGRKDIVIVVPLYDGISYMHETDTFIGSIEDAINRGAKLVIIEVDSPGGYVHMCIKICDKIEEYKKLVPIVAYIKGGDYNGAYSAAAAVSLACPKVYMAPDTAIGAATPYIINKFGKHESDDEFREKFSNYFAELAEKNNKPSLLAKAMVDKDFDVCEVTIDGQRHFWSKKLKQIFPKPKNRKENEDGTFTFNIPDNAIQHVWSENGQILTLSATDSETTGISDGTYETQGHLIHALGLSASTVVVDRSPNKARAEYEKMEKRVTTTLVRADQRIANFDQVTNYDSYINQLTKLDKELRDIINLYEKYPDLNRTRDISRVKEAYKVVHDYLHR